MELQSVTACAKLKKKKKQGANRQMKQTKRMAMCGMMAALSVVLMVLGGALGLGMYVSPLLAGLCLIPIGNAYGKKYQVILWLAVSTLSLLLVPNIEESLMYLCLFGCYPILRPQFQKLPKVLRFITKLLFFTVVFTALQLLITLVLVPEVMGTGMMVALIVLADVTLMVYDFVLPRVEWLLQKKLGKQMKQ